MTKVHPLDHVIKHQTEIDINDNNEEDSSPWVVKHKFPCWWVVLIIVFGKFTFFVCFQNTRISSFRTSAVDIKTDIDLPQFDD